MTAPAERMKAMRARRQRGGWRELRLTLPDARSPDVRRRVAVAVESLAVDAEDDALSWIEANSEFDDHPRHGEPNASGAPIP